MGKRCSTCSINLGTFENHGTDTVPLCYTCATSSKNQPDNTQRQAEHTADNSDQVSNPLFKQILVSILLVAGVLILQTIPYPAIDYEFLRETFGPASFTILKKISPFGLGINPYIYSISILFLISGFIPIVKNSISKSYNQKSSFNILVFFFTAILAAVQATAISLFLCSITSPADGTPLISGNPVTFRSLFTLSTVAGTLLIVWITNTSTHKGLINGVTALLCVSIINDLVFTILKIIQTHFTVSDFSTNDIFSIAAFVLFIFGLNYFLSYKQEYPISPEEKKESGDSQNDTLTLPLRINAQGILPLITSIPISNYLRSTSFFSLHPYFLLCTTLLLNVILTFLLILNHYVPQKTCETFKKFGYGFRDIPQKSASVFLERQITKTIIPSIVVYSLVYLFTYAFSSLYNHNSPLSLLFDANLMIIIMVIHEIIFKIRYTLHFQKFYPGEDLSRYVSVYSAQTQLEANIISDILMRNAIPSFVKNTHAVNATGTPVVFEICNPAHAGLTIARSMGRGCIEVLVSANNKTAAQDTIEHRISQVQNTHSMPPSHPPVGNDIFA